MILTVTDVYHRVQTTRHVNAVHAPGTCILPETPGRRIGQGAPATADERPWRPRTQGKADGDQATLPTVHIGPHHHPDQPAPTRLLLPLRHALDPERPQAAGDQEGSQEPARIASARRPKTGPLAGASCNIAACRL